MQPIPPGASLPDLYATIPYCTAADNEAIQTAVRAFITAHNMTALDMRTSESKTRVRGRFRQDLQKGTTRGLPPCVLDMCNDRTERDYLLEVLCRIAVKICQPMRRVLAAAGAAPPAGPPPPPTTMARPSASTAGSH